MSQLHLTRPTSSPQPPSPGWDLDRWLSVFPGDPGQPGPCAVFAVSGRPLSPIWQLKLSSRSSSFEAGSCVPRLPEQSLAHSSWSG